MSTNGFLALIASICFAIGLWFLYFDVIVAGFVFWFITMYLVNIVLLGQWWRRR